MAVWNLFFSSILIPLVAIALLALKTRDLRATWLTTLFMAAGLVGFSFFTAPWGAYGLGVRWFIGALFLAALVTSVVRRAPAEKMDEAPMRMLVKVLIGFFFGGVAVGVIRGHHVPASAFDAGFPLKEGRFLVLHGGSTPASNSHFHDERQRYAIDLVRLNAAWMRARGIAPADPSGYAIFGAAVVSPCDGTVEESVDGSPDGAPPPTAGGPPPNPLGNYLAIRCANDVSIFLGHLQRGSVAVTKGDLVTRGAGLARAGHSGASPEPHLHIHAERGGKAVPLTLGGKWLVRNGLVRR